MQEDTDLLTSKVMPNLLLVCTSGNLDRKKSREAAAALGYATAPVAEKQLRKEGAVARATKECKGSGHRLPDSHRVGFCSGRARSRTGGTTTVCPPTGRNSSSGKEGSAGTGSATHISAEASQTLFLFSRSSSCFQKSYKPKERNPDPIF